MVHRQKLVGGPDSGNEKHVTREPKPLLTVHGVCKSFGNETVLRDVSFSVKTGEVIGLVGPSGCGKSTLLRCINGLEKVDAGQVLLSAESSRGAEGRIGMVFQQFHLFSHMPVLENITLGLEKVKKMPRTEAAQKAKDLLAAVGLTGKAASYPMELSGGQQQRVAIARAMAMDPSLLLFDEPTSALDPEMIYEVLDVIRDIARRKTTMIIVTHEMNFIQGVAGRMLFLEHGEILEDAHPYAFFGPDNHPRIRSFLKRIVHYQDHDAFGASGGPSYDA